MPEEEEKIDIQKLRGYRCFACGTANPIGLNMEFYRLGDSVCSDITLGRYHEGWEQMAHGGIVSTLLDEVMSWTIMYFKKVFLVTRKIQIKYIKPVPLEIPLTVLGKIVTQEAPPRIEAVGEIRDENGSLLVRSLGEFVMLPEEKLSSVSEALKNDILSLFEAFDRPDTLSYRRRGVSN